MKPENMIMSLPEVKLWEQGVKVLNVKKIQNQFIADLPEKYQYEAKIKKLKLKQYHEDSIAKYYSIEIPRASKELKNYITKRVYRYVVVVKDYALSGIVKNHISELIGVYSNQSKIYD